jgi:drug/metabolite transporter (DMT)-like permease
MLSYLLAVLAACANATSSVLQRKANQKVPQRENLSWKLIRSLLHQPVWFGGILAITIGFVLQASALGAGELAVVEPILVIELPLTLILAARVLGSSAMGKREWGSTLAMTVGLAGLLYFLDPSAGRSDQVPLYVWLIGIGANLALVGVLVAWGRKGPAGRSSAGSKGSSSHQAAVFGVAGGSAFGLTAALMKGMTTHFSHGFGAIFTSWQLYAMVATGGLGMFLVQSALNAGRLIAAQPGLTLSDPIISILWGVLAFHERVRAGMIPLLFAALSTALMAGAVFALSRSPLLSEDNDRQGSSRAGQQARGRASQAASG